MVPTKKAILLEEGKVVPASCLDNVLVSKKSSVDVSTKIYNPITGDELTSANKKSFYQTIVNRTANNLYTTTDHVISCATVNNVHFLYVSLDNSVRSNISGHPLYERLDLLCDIVKKIINSLDGKCIVFFSESCRPSFKGGMNNKENITPWMTMRQIISERCGLKFLIEKRNNDDVSDMSFGISVFYTDDIIDNIQSYSCQNILTEGFGSVAVGVKLISEEWIWGIHFPLDFKGIGENNLGYKTMVNLQELMLKFNGSVCAFGDFNTIEGNISDSINQAITSDFEFVLKNELTFFGSYFDTIPLVPGEQWVSILDE